jgi:hypothetical protein
MVRKPGFYLRRLEKQSMPDDLRIAIRRLHRSLDSKKTLAFNNLIRVLTAPHEVSPQTTTEEANRSLVLLSHIAPYLEHEKPAVRSKACTAICVGRIKPNSAAANRLAILLAEAKDAVAEHETLIASRGAASSKEQQKIILEREFLREGMAALTRLGPHSDQTLLLLGEGVSDDNREISDAAEKALLYILRHSEPPKEVLKQVHAILRKATERRLK